MTVNIKKKMVLFFIAISTCLLYTSGIRIGRIGSLISHLQAYEADTQRESLQKDIFRFLRIKQDLSFIQSQKQDISQTDNFQQQAPDLLPGT